MEFGSQTGFASVIGSLGLDSEVLMMDSALGVVEGIDALSRSAASLHHMTVDGGLGKDVTPVQYVELVQANMARPFSKLVGSISLQSELRAGYQIPRRELFFNRSSSPALILTTTTQSRRFWVELVPSENAAYWEEFTIANFGWRSLDSREPQTDFVNATHGPLLSNDGSSLAIYYDNKTYIVTLFTGDDGSLHVTTWNQSDSSVSDYTYYLQWLKPTIGFGCARQLNEHQLLPIHAGQPHRVALQGQTAGSYRWQGEWEANKSFGDCAHPFFTAPSLPTTQSSVDKSIIATLISGRMILDACK